MLLHCIADRVLGSSPVLFGSWQVQLKFEDLMAWSLNALSEAYLSLHLPSPVLPQLGC